MFLSCLTLNPRNAQIRRELAQPVRDASHALARVRTRRGRREPRR